MKKTKVLATLGPACQTRTMVRSLVAAGVDGFRINTAHGDFEQYRSWLSLLRADQSSAGLPVVLDIKGPDLRLRTSKVIRIIKGDVFDLGMSSTDVSLDFDIVKDVAVGQHVLIDNGSLRTKVVKKSSNLRLVALSDGVLRPNAGVNIPGARLSIPDLSSKDRRALQFAKVHRVPYVALSFTRSRSDVARVRALLPSWIRVIAKVENAQGVENIDEIIDASDGVMVARGDLGVEIPAERVPIVQKDIIRKCNRAGKLAITATQMLESMIERPRPTRAETSDVANAILDGTDVVMLSGETAVGRFPVDAVKAMRDVAVATEPYCTSAIEKGGEDDFAFEFGKFIHGLSRSDGISKIVTLTQGGYTARLISRFRPQDPVIAITDNEDVCAQLRLLWGILPVFVPKGLSLMADMSRLSRFCLNKRLVAAKETILFCAVRSDRGDIKTHIEIHHLRGSR
ncbi:MAG: pyruvate kinase [Nanoarchaeota archaeon]